MSPIALRGVETSAPRATSVSSGPSSGAEPDDRALMLRYRDGDARAFEILYVRHKGALYRYLQRLCRNREAANDLFQETWGKVIGNRKRYEPGAQFAAFLYRIAHNCAVDYFRRAAHRYIDRSEQASEAAEAFPANAAEGPEARLSAGQLQAAFEQALNALPIEQRNVFVLYEETGLTLEEIAIVTGVGFETAKSRLRYALGKLRSALQSFDPRNASEAP